MVRFTITSLARNSYSSDRHSHRAAHACHRIATGARRSYDLYLAAHIRHPHRFSFRQASGGLIWSPLQLLRHECAFRSRRHDKRRVGHPSTVELGTPIYQQSPVHCTASTLHHLPDERNTARLVHPRDEHPRHPGSWQRRSGRLARGNVCQRAETDPTVDQSTYSYRESSS